MTWEVFVDQTEKYRGPYCFCVSCMQGHVGSLKQQPVKKLAHRECDPETQRARENNVEHNGKKDWHANSSTESLRQHISDATHQTLPPNVRCFNTKECQHIHICYTFNFATRCKVPQYTNVNIFRCYSQMLPYRNITKVNERFLHVISLFHVKGRPHYWNLFSFCPYKLMKLALCIIMVHWIYYSCIINSFYEFYLDLEGTFLNTNWQAHPMHSDVLNCFYFFLV